MFFCYSALESTAMLWASSYMALGKGIDKTTAAMWGSLFCIGITVGRLASGFLTMKLNDPAMIRLGQALVLDRHRHHAPAVAAQYRHHRGTNGHRFGLRADLSVRHPFHSCLFRRGQIAGHRRHADGLRLCGIDVHAAAVRLIAQHVSVNLFPFYLVVFLALMVAMHETLRRKCGDRAAA